MHHLSIITICFNNINELKETCASVDIQSQKPYEHLIIDGSTKPDIKEWLENNAQPVYRRWICEKDNGIGDAFNKGILNSKGDITYLLNSGDKIYDATVLQRVMDTFEKDPSMTWVNGKLNMYRGGIWAVSGKAFEKDKLYRGMHGVFHPTMYVNRAVYERCGLFDPSIKYAMDYDFVCRLINEKNGFIDYPLATFDPNGQSSQGYLESTKDMFNCYQKYYGKTLKQKLWGWRLVVLHHLLNSNFGKLLYRIKVKMGLQKV